VSRPRRALSLVCAVALLAGGTTGAAAEPVDFAAVACSLPHRYLVRIWRGVEPDRSGDVVIVAREPNFVGANYPHSGPWDYLQEVPMFWYGPGIVPATGRVGRPVTSADVAPTQAALVGFEGFHAPDGRTMEEVVSPDRPAPRLIVVLVWDAGGRNVLEAFPGDWPVLRSLIPRGVWYENATVGSSPSITPATHATIGTGAFPRLTGQVDAEFRVGPTIMRAGDLGPQLLVAPTFGDVYDRAMLNEPLVGTLASVTWHLNMMGHGAQYSGGDADVAVLRVPTAADNEGEEGTVWNLQGKNRPWFRFPSYANDLPPLSEYTRPLDAEDGAIDGRWLDNDIAQLEEGWATPARVPYQQALYDAVIRREGFGADDVPDLLFINSKIIDHVSHLFSLNSPEMASTLRWQDAALADLIGTLNREVGRRRWVLLVTADHGAQYDPGVSGAFQVTPPRLAADIEAALGGDPDRPVTEAVRVSQIFLSDQGLRDNGVAEDVASFVLGYTKGQATDAPLPAAEADDRVFAAAFPTSILAEPLPCLPEASGA
jgi:hypothetical protein